MWRFRTGNNTSFSPVCKGNRIIVGSYDHNVYCISIETGREEWRFKTGGEIVALNRAPLVDGIVYVSSMDNNLYAINTKNGKEAWRFIYGKHGSGGRVEYWNGRIYQGSRDAYLYCLDSKTGKEFWRFRAGSVIDGCTVCDGIAYFGSDDCSIYAVDATTGKKLWSFRTGAECFMTPSVYGGRVFMGSADCKLYCIDALIGSELWSFQTSSNQKSEFAPLYEEFKTEIKQSGSFDGSVSDEKYSRKAATASNYSIKSEYATTSDYKTKSNYDVNMIIFEENELMEALPWNSVSIALTPAFQTSM
jgi:outer membrane protein assembly factor BamB